MKYLVQAILVDGTIQTVTESFKTDDVAKTLEFVMQRHRNSYRYRYAVLEIDTMQVLVNTSFNCYQLDKMKLKCLQCGSPFVGSVSCDELGWHSSCPTCGGSFDVDLPEKEEMQ